MIEQLPAADRPPRWEKVPFDLSAPARPAKELP
jgi:hypothetical protein